MSCCVLLWSSALPGPDSDQIWTHIIFDTDITMSLGETDVWFAKLRALIDTQDDSVVSVHLPTENQQSERLFLHPVNNTGPNVDPCGAPAPLACRWDFTSLTPNYFCLPLEYDRKHCRYFCVQRCLDLFKQIAVCCFCGIIFFLNPNCCG